MCVRVVFVVVCKWKREGSWMFSPTLLSFPDCSQLIFLIPALILKQNNLGRKKTKTIVLSQVTRQRANGVLNTDPTRCFMWIKTRDLTHHMLFECGELALWDTRWYKNQIWSFGCCSIWWWWWGLPCCIYFHWSLGSSLPLLPQQVMQSGECSVLCHCPSSYDVLIQRKDV